MKSAKKRVHRGKAGGSWTKPRTRKRKNAGEKIATEPKKKKKRKQNDLIEKDGVAKVSQWLSNKEDKKSNEKPKVIDTGLYFHIICVIQYFIRADAIEVDKSSNEALMERLAGSRFRFINEQLYTMTGSDAQTMFKNDPEAFEAYHKGYEVQVTRWPKNPLDSVLAYLNKRFVFLSFVYKLLLFSVQTLQQQLWIWVVVRHVWQNIYQNAVLQMFIHMIYMHSMNVSRLLIWHVYVVIILFIL